MAVRPNALWVWDNSESEYVDLTSSVYSNQTIDFISDADDVFYIGCDKRFIGFLIDLDTQGGYTGLEYKYLTGDEEWGYISLIDSYNFSESKYCRWVLPEGWACVQFTDSFPHAADPPTSNEYYWIRLKASGVSAKAVIEKIRLLPYASYTTAAKVSEFLQTKRNFDYSTTPTDLQVENLIRRQEDYINYRTRKSWKIEAVTEDTDPVLVDYTRSGIYLRHRNFMKVYSIQLWNGGSWQRLEEGRDKDYHINYNLGMIMISRLFTLPAIYGMVGRFQMWGQGGFKNSLKVDYIYGRDPETDPEFYMVEDICTKLVAKDLLQHHDYSTLMVSGSDKVQMESKVRMLAEDAEARIDSLIGVVFY